MEKRRRAERLITLLRWATIAIAAAALADDLHGVSVGILAGLVAAYNVAMHYATGDPAQFARWGRRLSAVSRVLDAAVITLAVGAIRTDSAPAYLLYWFVLVAYGYGSGSVRFLAIGSAAILAANAGATAYAMGGDHTIADTLTTIGIRSAVILLGALVSVYIAKSRSQDELASERGSYLHAILDCGARLTSCKEVRDLAIYVLDSAVNETKAEGGQLLLVNGETNELECEAFQSSAGDAGAPTEQVLRSYANWVVGSAREFCVQIGGKASEGDDEKLDDRPAIAVPLLGQSSGQTTENSVLGVLLVWGYSGENFGPDALDILRIFAAIAGAAIVNLRLYTNLQRSFLSTLQTLANGLEARDEYTRGHSERVTQVSCLLAEELNVPTEASDSLRNAALLHDIGKIGVPDAILRKAGKLTVEEWETMRKHPEVSAEICRPLGLASEVLFLIEHHQERLDAKGYPAGLPAAEQPLLLRILVVADSFDAMRSRRPYRDVMPQEELVSELNRSAGRTLDPTVVEALKRLMDRGDMDAIYEEHDRAIGDVTMLRKQPSRKAA